VQQYQVEIIGTKLLQGHIDGLQRILIAIIANPDLGGEEQFLAIDAGILDALADFRLVEVRLCGVYMAVPGLDGLTHAALGIVLADLEDAVPDLRDFDAVDELHIFHVLPSVNSLI